jgi:hypothetical protein
MACNRGGRLPQRMGCENCCGLRMTSESYDNQTDSFDISLRCDPSPERSSDVHTWMSHETARATHTKLSQ